MKNNHQNQYTVKGLPVETEDSKNRNSYEQNNILSCVLEIKSARFSIALTSIL